MKQQQGIINYRGEIHSILSLFWEEGGISLCAKKNKEQFQYWHYCFNRVFAVITSR